MAKTARRQLGGRYLLFGEYLRSWTNLGTLSKTNLTSMQVSMFSYVFKLRIIIRRCYPPRPSASVDNTVLDLLNSSYPTQPHSLIANYLATVVQLANLDCSTLKIKRFLRKEIVYCSLTLDEYGKKDKRIY